MPYIRTQFEQLPEDASAQAIESTAEGLERYHFEPFLILDAPDFIHWRKKDMLAEYDRLTTLSPDAPELTAVVGSTPSQVVEKQLGLLLYHYHLLCRLRTDDASAWDVVHELYEDD
ncbi:MAG: hypothetical protein WCS59_05250 [Sphaerochaetaceae bacterium]|jgi:hypothetical protein|nr:hypothetical protein [Sphaerochaetaceae bacterium]MDD3366542.1 hypothetical protein [Sphaerochaetaceae bacterium]MDD4219357.1 hypothetical protein [Sphaerochaetaceae bacterium]